jgi:hypothetical protein
MNVYLFEKNITPLHTQKNYRELEMIVQECIMMAIRDSIPTEDIIRAYLDEGIEEEEEVTIEKFEEAVSDPEPVPDAIATTSSTEEETPAVVPSIQNIDTENVVTRLTFNDMDSVLDGSDKVKAIEAPKTIERLEEISTSRALQRKLEEQQEEDEDRIKIHTGDIDLNSLGLVDLTGGDVNIPATKSNDIVFTDFEELF